MDNREFKSYFIRYLYSRNVYITNPSEHQYRTRCVFCGDTQKRIDDGHLYIKINPNDNHNIVYNCFKCPAQGVLRPDDLYLFGLTDIEARNNLQYLNKTSIKLPKHAQDFVQDKFFDFSIPDIANKSKIEYIENRLGFTISNEKAKELKIITSLKSFLIENKIRSITCKPNMAKYLEKDFVGFLSNNGAYIVFRNIHDGDIKWFKYPILDESIGQKTFYSIKTDIDLIDKNDIEINLSEGIMDAISIEHHFSKKPSLNIAVCGKFYVNILKHLMFQGLIGKNIIVNIYADNDGADDTSYAYYRKIFSDLKWLFKEINVIYNLKDKDCGVKKENILLQKRRI